MDEQADSALAQARAHLARILEAGDSSVAAGPAVVALMDRLQELVTAGEADPALARTLGCLYWHRHLAEPGTIRGIVDEIRAIITLRPCFAAGLAELPEALLPELARLSLNDAIEMLERAAVSTDGELIAGTVRLWQRIVGQNKIWPPADQARHWSDLGVAQMIWFAHGGEVADLDSAIVAFRTAIELAPEDPAEQSRYLGNLSGALLRRYSITAMAADRDEAVAAGLRSASLAEPSAATGEPNSDRLVYASSLGLSLLASYEQSGQGADLAAAIESFLAAIDLAEAEDPRLAGILSNLGNGLLRRFELTGSAADLDDAVDAHRRAVLATADEHPDKVRRLSNLGVALQVRFAHSQEDGDLDEAIQRGRDAAAGMHAEDPDRGMILHGLGAALHSRFLRTGALADLDDAIGSLKARHDLAGRDEDLNEALEYTYLALESVPPDHHLQPMFMADAGHLLRAQFDRTGDRKALDLAAQMYQAAARTATATPSVRIDAAMAAAPLVVRRKPRQATALLAQAVRLLPQVAPRQLGRADQQHQLRRFSGLAADAAALVLASARRRQSRAQRAALALALIEHGRGILLSQALGTRNDLSLLREHHRELADRYSRLRDLLDQAKDAGAGFLPMPDDLDLATAGHLPDRRRLAGDFAATVAQIRGLDGFDTFMAPPAPGELIQAARQGSIVVINVSGYRSDALLLHPAFLDYLPLPGLTADILREKVEYFHRALALQAGAIASAGEPRGADDMLFDVLEWLWDAAVGPALDGLGVKGPPGPWGWPTVRWVPGGLLGQLPLHAAGYHRAAGERPASTAMDRVISSYSPTIRALLRPRVPAAAPDQPGHSLIVAMPTTPGASGEHDLRGVAAGAERLRDILPDARILMPPPHQAGVDPATISGSPTRTAVLDGLAGCSIAHFACRGTTDTADPSRSGLLLGDDRGAPLTVAELAPVRLSAARLAYLSACSTALSEVAELTDESVHLTSAFGLAGFPHVVGTLWQIDNEVAQVVAEQFYAKLRSAAGDLDTDRAAQALHQIVRRLREQEPGSPFLWAAYLHVGA